MADGKLKIIDFGNATVSMNKDGTGKKMTKICGTPPYMAPELFQKRQYDQSVDVFAFGCLLWEIFNRKVPYDGMDPSDIGQKVIKGEKLEDH